MREAAEEAGVHIEVRRLAQVGVVVDEVELEHPGRQASCAQRGEGLGMQILRTLVASELRGSIRWQPRPGGGTTVTITAQVPGEAGT